VDHRTFLSRASSRQGFARLLNDLPIAAKSLIAPSVSAAVMLGIVTLVLMSYRTIERANALSLGIAHAIEHAMDFTAELRRGHTALYRAVSLKSQEVELPIVLSSKRNAAEAWDKAGVALAALDTSIHSEMALEALGLAGVGAEAALTQTANDTLQAYVVIGKEALDFVEADAFVATMYLTGAEKKYVEAESTVAAIVADLNSRRGQIEQDATGALGNALYQVGGATALAILLSLTVALALARVISRPIKGLTDTMKQLASGDLTVELPNSARQDEIGSMTAALHTLRDSAIDAERAARQRQHSQKLEALGTLAGGIAHDLNNALVPVIALTKITARRLPEGGRDRANLDIVLHAAERGRDLVKQILAFSRKEKVEKQAVDLAEVARESLRMMRASVPSTARIVPEITAVPMMIGDPGQLQQVLVNLITNAAHAIGDEMGRITVGVHRRVTRPGGENIVLSVEDTGQGMDEATRTRIFDPFFTTKPVGEGTGLGLSVVHGIVADHSGRIEVNSRAGEGSRFVIYFPAAAAEPAQGAPAVLSA
jgi:signal transduction histidine kinase